MNRLLNRKEKDDMSEHENLIAFTDEQLDFILAYQKESGADTVQDAILNAISIAFDDQDGR